MAPWIYHPLPHPNGGDAASPLPSATGLPTASSPPSPGTPADDPVHAGLSFPDLSAIVICGATLIGAGAYALERRARKHRASSVRSSSHHHRGRRRRHYNPLAFWRRDETGRPTTADADADADADFDADDTDVELAPRELDAIEAFRRQVAALAEAERPLEARLPPPCYDEEEGEPLPKYERVGRAGEVLPPYEAVGVARPAAVHMPARASV